MEVKMNKEIRDYQESIFFGLNFRQCAFSVLGDPGGRYHLLWYEEDRHR